MDTLYLETTVVGTIAGRLHPNPGVAARQRMSRRWWASAKAGYQLFVSQLVVEECAAGDPSAAQERLDEIGYLPRLDITDDVLYVAQALMDANAIPPTEPRDALHVAVASVHGMHYLVTWNFKHIANATRREQINAVCRMKGFEPPIICTPEELGGTLNETTDTD